MNDRTEELEARMAWYEHQLHDLDAVVRDLYDEVARLRREIEALQQASEPDPIDEKPPHY